MRHAITFGRKYSDEHTGFEGIAVSVHYYEHGCERIVLEALHDGKIVAETFDAPRLTDVETGAPVVMTEPKTGGDRPTPAARATPGR